MDEPQTADAEGMLWRVVGARGLRLRVGAQSFENRSARKALETITQTASILNRVLQPEVDRLDSPIELILAPGILESDTGIRNVESVAPRQNIITLDAGDSGAVVRSTVDVLVRQWFGAPAVSVPLFVDGLAGLVRARMGTGPDIRAAHDAVLATIDTGRPASIYPQLRDGAQSADPDPVATSFVAYLIGLDNGRAFGAFLRAFDPQQRDDAADIVYHQPLGSLEAAWHGFVRHRAREGTAFRALFRHLLPLIRPYKLSAAEAGLLMVLSVALTRQGPAT
jgi:hypothetical protein